MAISTQNKMFQLFQGESKRVGDDFDKLFYDGQQGTLKYIKDNDAILSMKVSEEGKRFFFRKVDDSKAIYGALGREVTEDTSVENRLSIEDIRSPYRDIVEYQMEHDDKRQTKSHQTNRNMERTERSIDR